MSEVIKPPMPVIRSLSERLTQISEAKALKESRWKDVIRIEVDTKGSPYFVLHPLSDLHLGHAGVDMGTLAKHLSFIKNENVHTVWVGDLGDFFLPKAIPSGMLGDVITPAEQLEALTELLKEYEKKSLGIVNDPSHPGWVNKTAGLDIYEIASRGLDIPLLNTGGILELVVGSQTYRIALFHKIHSYNSSLNRLNAHHRIRELHQDVDCVIAGHRHIGAIEKSVHREGKPMFVQMGTFKIDDQYGVREGMIPRPQVFFPTLFFDARKKNIEMIEDLSTAGEFVSAVSQYHRQVATGVVGIAKRTRRKTT